MVPFFNGKTAFLKRKKAVFYPFFKKCIAGRLI
jgi:hypothetical protein